MKHTYDKKTAGFRTIRNLRGYNDDERGFPPSEVDDSDYEDINVLVKRFMKGEIISKGRPVHFDGAAAAEDMIAAANPFQADGADLADVGPITDAIKAREKARADAKKEPAPPLKKPAKKAQEPKPEPAPAPEKGEE